MKYFLTLLFFFFTLLSTSMRAGTDSAASLVGKIANTAGAAVLLHGEKVLPPTAGTPLYLNDIARTEKGGVIRLQLSDGSALTLSEDTELRVTQHDAATEQTTIELLRGHVLSQNTPVTKQGGRFMIRTPTAMVVALGTSLEVQTAPGSGSPGSQIVLQDNGQPVSGADVALVLANMNKISLGKTNEQGEQASALDLANASATAAAPALDLANLNKIPLHAEVDECEDGTKQVYLVGPNGTLPPPRKNCKRKRLAGEFFWGKAQRIALDVARGTSTVTDLSGSAASTGASGGTNAAATGGTTSGTPGATGTTGAASGGMTGNGGMPGTSPKNLSEIPPNVSAVSGNAVSLASFTGVGSTAVRCLDHFVGVANIDPRIPGVTYLLPDETTFVDRGASPKSAMHPDDKQAFDKIRERIAIADQKHVAEFGFGTRRVDFDVAGRTCEPGLVINGQTISGAPNFNYKITGMGTSTGNALMLVVTNHGTCPLYFLITDGTIFHPKGFTERVLTGIILGGTPSLKDFQTMLSMGGFLIVLPAGVLGAGPAAPSSGEASMPLRSFCVELHKLAPHPKTEYRFGDPGEQENLGGNRQVVDRTFSMVQTGQLKLPPQHSMDSVTQWSLWSKIEGMDEKKFVEEYLKLTHKNYEAKKQKWDKSAEQMMETAARGLWPAVQKVLH
ncbi:MAG: hypothetical protein NVS9B4_12740 [Candidatus Acidiferrum sp.]